MKNKVYLRDLIWTVPVSLILGAVLALFDRGTWWIGWLAYSLVGLICIYVISMLWRWAGASRTLGLILILAAVLRLGIGVALTEVLPVYGHDSPVDKAGYVFRDAYNRDSQAWTLASSSDSLLKAFDKSYSTDQYGGQLFLYSILYRVLSPDHQRPWLVILLGALTSVMGIAIGWKAASKLGDGRLTKPTAWVLALYPEAVLLASSEMREPYLMTFIAMAFWGVLDWQLEQKRSAWIWMTGAVVGLLFFNPAVAIFALLALGGWLLLRSERVRISWQVALIAVGVGAVALVLLWLGLARGHLAGKPITVVFSSWLQLSSKWDTYILQQGSGWIEDLFKKLPESLHIPFAVAYGLTQPVLPAAVADPTVWPWKVIAILRALGWYTLLPFFLGSLLGIWQMKDHSGRRSWAWVWGVTAIWIVVSSYRAGGDQWDNPRYRVIFLLWQSLLAAYAWVWWRETRNPWMGRILAVEGDFLVIFGGWYFSRYVGFLPILPIWVILAAIVCVSVLILAGGWAWDLRKKSKLTKT